MMTMFPASLAYGEETTQSTRSTLPTTYAELLQLYERAIAAGEKIEIPDDILARAKEEIKRIGAWQYHVITLNAPQDQTLEHRLNELGRELWDCHATPREHDTVRLVCKRPVRSYLKNMALTDLLRLLP